MVSWNSCYLGLNFLKKIMLRFDSFFLSCRDLGFLKYKSPCRIGKKVLKITFANHGFWYKFCEKIFPEKQKKVFFAGPKLSRMVTLDQIYSLLQIYIGDSNLFSLELFDAPFTVWWKFLHLLLSSFKVFILQGFL